MVAHGMPPPESAEGLHLENSDRDPLEEVSGVNGVAGISIKLERPFF